MLFSTIAIFGLFVSKLTSAIVEVGNRHRLREKRLTETRAYMDDNGVNYELSSMIAQHIRSRFQRTTSTEGESQILAELPVMVRRELLLHVRMRRLLPHAFFRAWFHLHRRSFERLCCDK